jgi:hypothetical protein
MSTSARAPSWLAQRSAVWRRVGESLANWRRGRLSRQDALKSLADYRGIARDVASARKALPGNPITVALETLYASLHAIVNREPRHTLASLRHLYAVEVRAGAETADRGGVAVVCAEHGGGLVDGPHLADLGRAGSQSRYDPPRPAW